jgi:hypothetical protein
MSTANTGLVQVSRQIAAGSGLTPTLNANGSYSVASTAGFSGTWVVTLGAVDGASKDAVHLVAAEAVSVDLAGLTSLTGSGYANGTITGTAAGVLVYGAPIAVGQPGDVVTLTFDYTSSAPAAIAGVLFDGALGQILAFTNPSGGNIATGKAKSISMSMVTLTGTVIPAVQVAGAATVTIANMAVVKAGPVTDYALNPNATAYKSGLANLDGWGSDILGSGASAPTADADNNFAGAAGSMKLAGAGGIANAHVIVPLTAGTAVAECYAKKASGNGVFALVLTDGAGMSSETFSALSDSWSKVIAVCTPSAATNGILVVQAAGFDVVVDDVCIRVVKDDASFADLALLGM